MQTRAKRRIQAQKRKVAHRIRLGMKTFKNVGSYKRRCEGYKKCRTTYKWIPCKNLAIIGTKRCHVHRQLTKEDADIKGIYRTRRKRQSHVFLAESTIFNAGKGVFGRRPFFKGLHNIVFRLPSCCEDLCSSTRSKERL